MYAPSAEERAVPDRHLAVVAGEDVEAGRRDPDVDRFGEQVDVAPASFYWATYREPVAEEHDADDGRRRTRASGRDRRPSTRATSPRLGLGAASSHALHVDLAEQAGGAEQQHEQDQAERHDELDAVERSRRTRSVSALATPTIRPPTTAPSGLSKPPSAAAANANTRIDCIDAAVSAVVVGTTSEPASAPSAAASPHPSMSIVPTDTPTSRLDSGFDATARKREPDLGLLEQELEQQRTRRASTPTSTSVSASTIDAAEVPVLVRVGARHGFGLDAEDHLRERVEREEHADRDDDDHERRRLLDRPHHEPLDQRRRR